MINRTDFRKTVETGVDPRLTGVLFFFLLVFYTFVLFLSSSHREPT